MKGLLISILVLIIAGFIITVAINRYYDDKIQQAYERDIIAGKMKGVDTVIMPNSLSGSYEWDDQSPVREYHNTIYNVPIDSIKWNTP